MGVNTELIFKNSTVLPNATSIEESLKTAIAESKLFLGVIPSSITVGEFPHLLILFLNVANDMMELFLC